MQFKTLLLFLSLAFLSNAVSAQIVDPDDVKDIKCGNIVNIEQTCDENETVTITFQVYNNSGVSANLITVTDGISYTESYITNLANMSVSDVTFTYTGASMGSELCLTILLYNGEGECCHQEICFDIISKCCNLESMAFTTPSSCTNPDGTAIITVYGGTEPYTGTFGPNGHAINSNGFGFIFIADLAAGDYVYTLTDANGCTVSGSFVVDNGDKPTIDISTTPSECNEPTGTALLTISGGTGPYSGKFGPNGHLINSYGLGFISITDLAPGEYVFNLIDANGCPVSGSFVIENLAGIELSLSTTGTACDDDTGTVSMYITGGNGPFTGKFGPNGHNISSNFGVIFIPNLAFGVYDYTLTDQDGCTITGTFEIEYLECCSSVETTVAKCINNGTAVITIVGADGPFSGGYSPNGAYLSSQNGTITITDLAPGVYEYYLSNDDGCETTGTFEIKEETVELLTQISTSSSLCVNEGTAIIEVSGGTSPYKLRINSTGQVYNSVGGAFNITNLSGGFYSFTITDADGCTHDGSFEIMFGDSDCDDFAIEAYGEIDDPIGLFTVYEGISDVNQEIFYCFTTDNVPDQLIITVDGAVVVDSGPWTSLDKWSTNDNCPDSPDNQGEFKGSFFVEECDEFNISVHGVPCGLHNVRWYLHVSCTEPNCQNGNNGAGGLTSGEINLDVKNEELDILKRSTSNQSESVEIFPNPVQDNMHVILPDNDVKYSHIKILSTSSHQMMEKRITEHSNMEINTSTLPAGTYILVITSENRDRVTKRFVKPN